jgi:uncharacterized membrane protein YccF (DUF307 family)
MPLIRVVWMCTIGAILAAMIYTLALLFAITIIGLPVAMVDRHADPHAALLGRRQGVIEHHVGHLV